MEQRTAPPPAAAQAAAAAEPMQEDAAPEGGGEFAGAIAGPGMDALVEGEPDDENEAQYLVGCAFEGSSAAGSGSRPESERPRAGRSPARAPWPRASRT